MQLNNLCLQSGCVFIFINLQMFIGAVLLIFIVIRQETTELRSGAAVRSKPAWGGRAFAWLRLRVVGQKLAPFLLGGGGFLRLSSLTVIFSEPQQHRPAAGVQMGA